jgi:hypothetical protein
MAEIQVQRRQVGDTRIALAATLVRPDLTVVDLTALTPKFKMCTAAGVDKVAETTDNVAITDAENGQIQYNFQDDDVDTEGTFHAYFIIEEGGAQDTFPVDAGLMQVRIMGCK